MKYILILSALIMAGCSSTPQLKLDTYKEGVSCDGQPTWVRNNFELVDANGKPCVFTREQPNYLFDPSVSFIPDEE